MRQFGHCSSFTAAAVTNNRRRMRSQWELSFSWTLTELSWRHKKVIIQQTKDNSKEVVEKSGFTCQEWREQKLGTEQVSENTSKQRWINCSKLMPEQQLCCPRPRKKFVCHLNTRAHAESSNSSPSRIENISRAAAARAWCLKVRVPKKRSRWELR